MNTVNFAEIATKYSDEASARELMESLRWPNGPVCPFCQSTNAYKLTAKSGSKRPVRAGVYKCANCRRQYTITVGTIFEDTRIPLHKWLMAIYLMCASKKGISAHQLHRMLGITYKSAWFMCHRIRYAMTQAPLNELLSGTVEVDETYVGGKPRGNSKARKVSKKVAVMALVERGGEARAMTVKSVDAKSVYDVMMQHISNQAHVMTDGSPVYYRTGADFPTHSVIDHNKEYVNGNVHINTAEGWFALLKRGLMGTFHHVSEQHLDRYAIEFCFRYNRRKDEDGDRAVDAVVMAKGKRLYYKTPLGKSLVVK
jgi:transposase-like protein